MAPRSHRRKSPRPCRSHILRRPERRSPRGLVSGATKISPSSAQAARYSPFSVTLAWVQVRPDRYQTTGSFSPARPAAAKRSRKSCPCRSPRTHASRPAAARRAPCSPKRSPWLTAPAGEVRRACCRPDRACRRGTSSRSLRRGCRAGPRSTCRRWRLRGLVPGIDLLRARRIRSRSSPPLRGLPAHRRSATDHEHRAFLR